MRRASGGFTLVEVLVAIGIVGFGLVSLLTLLPVGLRSTRLAGDFTTAAFLARQELHEIRSRAAVQDYIDDNLNGIAEATDGNGVRDPSEPFESGWRLVQIGTGGIPTGHGTGMAFSPAYTLGNEGTGTFITAAGVAYTAGPPEDTDGDGVLDGGEDLGFDLLVNDPLDDSSGVPNRFSDNDGVVAESSVGEGNGFLDVIPGPDLWVFTCILDSVTGAAPVGSEVFSVYSRRAGRQANATVGVAYDTDANELRDVFIPHGRSAGQGQDAVTGRSWRTGDSFRIRTCGNCRDGDGVGFFDLPPTTKKGRLKDVRVLGLDPTEQTWTLTCLPRDPAGDPATFRVRGSVSGPQLAIATAGVSPATYESDDGEIRFAITENTSRIYDGESQYHARWQPGDSLVIKVAVVERAAYALWAQRADVGEDRMFTDRDLESDGIDNDGDGTTDEAGEAELDGVLTKLSSAVIAAGFDRPEDTGLDLVPDFYDAGFDGVATDDRVGEAGFAPGTLNDPHGDNNLTENNRRAIAPYPADRFPEWEVQQVTVTIMWREGGRTRVKRFSTAVANRYL